MAAKEKHISVSKEKHISVDSRGAMFADFWMYSFHRAEYNAII